jgi:hypothetical protein
MTDLGNTPAGVPEVVADPKKPWKALAGFVLTFLALVHHHRLHRGCRRRLPRAEPEGPQALEPVLSRPRGVGLLYEHPTCRDVPVR